MTSIKFVGARELQQALRLVMKVTTKTEAEIVNKTLKDVAFRASSFTPKTTAAKIKSELREPHLLAAIASKWLKKKEGFFTKEKLADYMGRIVRARASHAGAVRVGWFPAITALGGTIRGSKDSAFSHLGSAAKGGAQPASIRKLSGEIRNMIFTRDSEGRKSGGAEIKQAVTALNKAISFIAHDRLKYAEDELRKALKKFS